MNFFKKRKTVLYVSDNNLEAGIVVLGNNPTVIDYVSIPWSEDSIDNSIKKLTEKVRSRKFVLTLGENLVQLVNLTVPNNLTEEEESEFRSQELSRNAKSYDGNTQWQFREIYQHSDKKEILAYTPIPEKFKFLSDALRKAQCRVECIESDIFAKTKNPNVLIGSVLGDTQKDGNNPTKLKTDTRIFLIIPVMLILVMFGIADYRIMKKPGDMEVTSNITEPNKLEITGAKETTQSTQTIEVARKEQFDPQKYSVKILNGTKVEGLAAKTAKEFSEAGFSKVEIDNADDADYEETKVYFDKKSDNIELKIHVLDLLGLNESSLSDTEGEENSDVVIVLGYDFAKRRAL